jgi:hypothetical protein
MGFNLAFKGLKEKGRSRITTAETKILRKTIKYTHYDHKRNKHIMKELKTQTVLVQINNCNNKRIQQVNTMVTSRLMHTIMKYQPAGKPNPE